MAAPDVGREPDISVILIEFRGPTEFATKFVVPLVYPLGTFRVPSVLLLTFVMIYFEESTVKEYVMGMPLVNQVVRLVPFMVTVP